MNMNETNASDVKDEGEENSSSTSTAPPVTTTTTGDAGATEEESTAVPPADDSETVSSEVSDLGNNPAVEDPEGQEEITTPDFPPAPELNSDVVTEANPFPPAPRLGSRRTVWANGRQYGSLAAAAIALGVTEDIISARVASTDENYSSYHWAE